MYPLFKIIHIINLVCMYNYRHHSDQNNLLYNSSGYPRVFSPSNLVRVFNPQSFQPYKVKFGRKISNPRPICKDLHDEENTCVFFSLLSLHFVIIFGSWWKRFTNEYGYLLVSSRNPYGQNVLNRNHRYSKL